MLLQPYQYFSPTPKFFQPVIITLFWRKKVYDHIAKVDHHPAGLGDALDAAVQPKLLFRASLGLIRQCVEHALAGTGANHEVVGKGGDFLNLHQNDIFPLFFFQNINDVASNLQSIQLAPLLKDDFVNILT